ncbi:hypothetical protein TruAng_002304 [Truncatella angustata]|nr:hypothetical protein TruAng_002304 [Truncatella angustata]
MNSSGRNALRRTACDCCRQQRLKCLRDENQANCQRCIRLGKPCQMAATRRPGRPRKSRQNPPAAASSVIRPTTPESVPGTDQAMPSSLALDDISSIIPNLLEQDNAHDGLDVVRIRTNNDFRNFDIFNPLASSVHGATPGTMKQMYPMLDMHQCLKDLSEINIELHAQWIEARRRWVDTRSLPDLCSNPTYVDVCSYAFAERTLASFQKFYDAINNVEWIIRKHAPGRDTSDIFDIESNAEIHGEALGLFTATASTEGCWEKLFSKPSRSISTSRPTTPATTLVMVIISCYVQLISILTMMCAKILNNLKYLKSNEAIDINSVRFFQIGSLCVWDARLEGLMFCTMIIHYLDRSQRILGLLPGHRRQSVQVQCPLLDRPQYRDLLEKELKSVDSSGGPSPEKIRDVVEDLRRALEADPSW